jgi:hypothetical protein
MILQRWHGLKSEFPYRKQPCHGEREHLKYRAHYCQLPFEFGFRTVAAFLLPLGFGQL